MCRKESEPDGVDSIGPRPVDEGEPGKSRPAQQEAAEKQLHYGISLMMGALG